MRTRLYDLPLAVCTALGVLVGVVTGWSMIATVCVGLTVGNGVTYVLRSQAGLADRTIWQRVSNHWS